MTENVVGAYLVGAYVGCPDPDPEPSPDAAYVLVDAYVLDANIKRIIQNSVTLVL